MNLDNDIYNLLIKNVENYFNLSKIILQNDRNIVKEVDFNNEKIIIKSFKIPNIVNKIAYFFFKKSKAKKSYEFALKIPNFTPKPIAYTEINKYFLLHKSYFICKKFDFDFNMQEPLFRENDDKDNILKQFASFVFALHQQKILHRDLSPGNILIKKQDNCYKFQIIDINRMTFGNISFKQKAKNFNKLWASNEDLVIILTEYARIAKINCNSFVQLGLKYNQKNKDFKTTKRNIKAKLGL